MKPISHFVAWLMCLTFTLLLMAPTAAAQGWTRLVNTALQASSTNSVCPADNPAGYPAGSTFSAECYTKINSWVGAAADTKRSRLLILHAGGHDNSNGNESYSLDLATPSATTATGCLFSSNGCRTNATAPTMTRLDNPSVWSYPPVPNADGTPWSAHTYGGTVYLPLADKVVSWHDGSPDSRLWLWNAVTGAWLDSGYSGFSDGNDGAYCTLDPTQAQESIICIVSSGGASVRNLVRYNAITNTATLLASPTPHWQDSPGAVVDPDRKLFLSFGNSFAGTPSVGASLLVTDLSNPSYPTTDWTSTITGCNDLIQNGYPGVQWDPTLHKVVGYVPRKQSTSTTSNTIPTSGFPVSKTFTVAAGLPITPGTAVTAEGITANPSEYTAYEMVGTISSYNSSTGVLVLSITSSSGSGTYSNWIINTAWNGIITFDPGTRTCVVNPLSSSSTGPQPDYAMLALGRGMFGRFSYFPALNKYAIITDYASDAWTLQLNATPTNGLGASKLTCVDRDGDGYGTGPQAVGPFTDLVIDAGNNRLISSASHSFTAADVSHFIHVTGGSGFAVAENNTIVSVAGGKATMLNAVGTAGSTGGNWQIDGCLGADADDQDASSHTATDVLTKWGSMTAYLAHLGYNPANIWYVSPTGNDGIGVVNDPTHPFLTCCGSGKANPVAGDALMFRGGTYASFFDFDGTVGHPAYFLAYPGETPLFVPGSGTPCSTPNYRIYDGLTYNGTGGRGDVECSNSTGVVFSHIYAIGQEWGIVSSHMNDFTITDSTLGENWSAGCGTNQHAIYVTNHIAATPSTNVFIRRNLLERSCYNGVQVNGTFSNVVVEQNISYGHGIGGIAFLNGVSNSTVRSNLSFNNAQTDFNIFSGIDFCSSYGASGIGTTCPYDQTNNLIENNTMYATGVNPIDGSSSQSTPSIGVTNAPGWVVATTSSPTAISSSGSVTFNIASYSNTGTYGYSDIVIYAGNLYTSINAVATQPDINPGDWGLIGPVSLISTFWPIGTRTRACQNAQGDAPCLNFASSWNEGIVTGTTTSSVTISMDASVGSGTFSNWIVNLRPIGNLGGNTFRNNILVSYSPGCCGGVGYPNFRYDDAAYVATSTYQSNVFYNLYPTAGTHTNVIQTSFKGVPTYYTCAAAMAGSGTVFGSFTNCQNADPQFVGASPSYWNVPSSFDLRLQSSSPAVYAGTSAAGALTYGLIGTPFANRPSIGAYESMSTTGPPPSAPPPSSCDINRDGVVDRLDVTASVNQALGVTPCGTADLIQNGQCSVVDVQRVIIAAMGGACKVGQ